MADFKRDKNGKIVDDTSDDFNTVPRADFIPVNIPSFDLMGHEFPTIRINAHEFHAGQEHMVPPGYAEHIEQIIKRVQADAVRILRPTADVESLKQASQYGSGDRRVQYTPVV